MHVWIILLEVKKIIHVTFPADLEMVRDEDDLCFHTLLCVQVMGAIYASIHYFAVLPKFQHIIAPDKMLFSTKKYG